MTSVKSHNQHRDWQIYLLAVFLILGLSKVTISAQEPKPELEKAGSKKELMPEKSVNDSTASKNDKPASGSAAVKKKPASASSTKIITDEERNALRREKASEAEAAYLPYINNFFATLRLGPEDNITVDVFDQPIYSRANITVPPNGKINYPLIGQIMIAGRTTDEIEKEITERLIEYIIDPKVTVQINQVHSLKYVVVGDVNTPGTYEMTRRMTVTEGLARAGYFSKYGKRSNVTVLRMQPHGLPTPLVVNIKEVERGKAEDLFLVPGDTVVVYSSALKAIDQVLNWIYVTAWLGFMYQ